MAKQDGILDVEKTSVANKSNSWLPILLSLLGLLALLFIVLPALGIDLLNKKDQNADKSMEASQNEDSSKKADRLITVGSILSMTDKASLPGKMADFEEVKVQSVTGDRTFWVGDDDTSRLFVVLDEKLDAGGEEENIVVEEGQVLSLSGPLTKVSDETLREEWGLDEADIALLQEQTVYLLAQKMGRINTQN